jgi:hypothetical protein
MKQKFFRKNNILEDNKNKFLILKLFNKVLRLVFSKSQNH